MLTENFFKIIQLSGGGRVRRYSRNKIGHVESLPKVGNKWGNGDLLACSVYICLCFKTKSFKMVLKEANRNKNTIRMALLLSIWEKLPLWSRWKEYIYRAIKCYCNADDERDSQKPFIKLFPGDNVVLFDLAHIAIAVSVLGPRD